jgi:probable F420-dependent oxidoreductase
LVIVLEIVKRRLLVAKDFRFSLSMRFFKSRAALVEKVKRAEDLGYDILCVPDHLGAAAPFPTLTAVAMVTTRIRMSMYVLNAAFYKPALLSRDLQALDVLSDGRLEIGLGTGYVREEFEAAELPYPSAGARVDYLEHMTTYLKEHHPSVPILIAGNGDRVLTLAARHADQIGLTGAKVRAVDDPLAERIEFVRNAAGDRFDALELNMVITALPREGETIPDLKMTRAYAPDSSDEELLSAPSVLSGTPREMADTLSEYREKYGLTCFTVQDNHIENFAKVIAELR